MDPWKIVNIGGEPALFGFMTWHPVTGGLAWSVTSRLVEPPLFGTAVTASRTYLVGQALWAGEVTLECEVAYRVLVTPEKLTPEQKSNARLLLTASKMARWLGMEVPDPMSVQPADLERFISEYRERYREARAIGRPTGWNRPMPTRH